MYLKRFLKICGINPKGKPIQQKAMMMTEK